VKIFKVSRPEGDKIEYDQYSGFVCVAPDEESARRLHPRHYHVWVETTGAWHWKDGETGLVEQHKDMYHSWTCDIDALVVQDLGTPSGAVLSHVILASYHAG